MQSGVIRDLYNFIKVYHATQDIVEHDLAEGRLKCELRGYQRDAVRWMLNKELSPAVSITFQGNQVELPSGGILADEMGLGKTVEVLGCILSNPCPVDDISLMVRRYSPGQRLRRSPKKRHKPEVSGRPEPPSVEQNNSISDVPASKKTGIHSEKYAYLRSWYEQAVGPEKPPRSSVALNVKCFCSVVPEFDETVICQQCGTEQHKECVNVHDLFEYICPWCWSKEEPLTSGATFIVCPLSILPQWTEEITRHVNDQEFKVLVYDGVKSKKYIQPTALASYDVIITTYTTLRTELNYSNDDSLHVGRSLRHAKKYYSPASPLTCVRWWRLCLDEAQMIEGRATAAAKMARKLTSIHRWAVTGTPIQKCLSDLFGLVEYLQIEPYRQTSHWNSLMKDKEEFENFFATIMWRNLKKDVFQMLGVPPQTTQVHWLSFAPIEEYFYKKMKDECSKTFIKNLVYIQDIDARIKSYERRVLDKLLNPLLRLRQACIHPQVVRGKFLKFKHIMKLEDLIVDMATKAKIEFSNALRQLVTAINGLAAITIIDSDRAAAVNLYRKVLGLDNEYKSICKVDTLQMIHTMHNLSEILDTSPHGVAPTLRDSQLRNEVKELESSYLKKIIEMLDKTKQRQTNLTEAIEKIYEEKSDTLGYTDWWCRVINSSDSEDLRTRIVTHLDNQHGTTSRGGGRGMTINAKKLSSMPSIYNLLGIWLADADDRRIATLKGLASLDTIETDALVNSAYRCHLNKMKSKKKSERCKLCEVEELLLTYEKTIFSISESKKGKRKRRFSGDGSSSEGDDLEFSSSLNKKNEKEIAELKEAEILSLKSEGNWGLTDQERILQILSNYAKVKKAPEEWVSDSVKHLALLELVRKEFKLLRDHWRHINYSIAASDEISMCKLRLRLATVEELLKFDQMKKSRPEHIFIIFPHEVESQRRKLLCEKTAAEHELKETHGIYLYLERLRSDGCVKNEPCPVCQEPLQPTSKWSVLQCGHCVCLDCFSSMMQLNPQSEVECPLCRVKTPKQCVSYAVEEDCEVTAKASDLSKSVEEAAAATLAQAGGKNKLKGSYSTKVEAVTRTLLDLIADDPDVKVLVFSAWVKVLDVISEALLANNILFRRMETGKNRQIALQQFKTSSSISALLIPIHLGSKGLNIIEATHVFLVEPMLNPADELQAIGRVHRIGQTKPTFVHRFAIRNTVEEKIVHSLTPVVGSSSSTSADGDSESDAISADEHLTVRQLMDLFY